MSELDFQSTNNLLVAGWQEASCDLTLQLKPGGTSLPFRLLPMRHPISGGRPDWLLAVRGGDVRPLCVAHTHQIRYHLIFAALPEPIDHTEQSNGIGCPFSDNAA